ncbi:uncharacterized protein KY384_001832 [Bacidia gigantensis]|uniref:uncharacterized protein n=1 Tax=Bacidia gigantensis TaxID=2732470 RepID=UPI001D0402D3|nr:uncharacterized protein KY384_001832 [Bacidia gigantensis]KAG8533049.1 hypothetical protein KY384_001832 [Bacidia gigantensis]
MSRDVPTATPLKDKRILLITIVLTLGNLAICIHRSSRIYLYQQSQCLQHYLAADPQKVSAEAEVEEEACKIKEVQSPLSIIEGVDAFLSLLPVIAAILPPDQLSLYVLASVTGSAVGALLLSHHVYILNLLGILCAILAIVFAVLLPESLGRETFSDKSTDTSTTDIALSDRPGSRRSSSALLDKPQGLESIPRILLTSWKSSLYSVLTLFRVADPTFTVILLFFVQGIAGRVEVIGAQYISLTLNWTLATVNSLLTIKALVSALVLLALPTIRKVYLEPRMEPQQIDLFIIKASLIPNAIGMIGLGFSLPTTLFITFLMVYTSGVGLYASLTTFGKMTLPAGEAPSDFFVKSGLVQVMAGLVSSPTWSFIFSLCLKNDWLPLGLSFWISAGLFVVAIALTRRLSTWSKYVALPQGS